MRDGAYVAPLLPVGHYKLVVISPGFQQYNATNIVLNVSDRRVIGRYPQPWESTPKRWT